jgi:hypothetical protein
MAEPAVPLPDSVQKNEPVPWPNAVQPEPREVQLGSQDIAGSIEPSTADDIKKKLRSGAEHSVEIIQRGYEEVQHAASRAVSRANRKLRYLADERPVQIVVGIAVAAFLTGAALRIWRSNHD